MVIKWRKFVRGTEGAIMFYTALLLAVLLGFTGLVIDIAHYVVVRNELKNAADAGALAGVRALFPYDMSTATPPLTPDCSTAVSVGGQTVQWNKTDNDQTVVADIQTGRWDGLNRQFVAGCSSDPANFTNAVQVTTHRQDTPLYIMQVLGMSPQTLQASSVAVVDWVGGLKPGGGFPVAISKHYVKPEEQLPQPIKIYLNDDTSDVGCWFLKGATDPGDFAEKVKNIILDRENLMPAVKKNDWIWMNNGVITVATAYINNSYIGQTLWLPVVNEIKFRQSDQIQLFAGFEVQELGKDNGKHYIGGVIHRLAEVPADIVDVTGEDGGLLSSPRLAL
jgi:hypothetical protein